MTDYAARTRKANATLRNKKWVKSLSAATRGPFVPPERRWYGFGWHSESVEGALSSRLFRTTALRDAYAAQNAHKPDTFFFSVRIHA